jgi:TolB protein
MERGPLAIPFLIVGGLVGCMLLACVLILFFRSNLEDMFGIDDSDDESNTSQSAGNGGIEPTALPTFDTSVSVSGEGNMLFVSNRTGQWEIYRMNPDGSGITQLTFNSPDYNYSPEWSPDGQQIVFEARRANNWDIYVMDADGSNVRQLTTDPATDRVPAWSPDGSLIAFGSNRRGNFDIYVMNTDGSNARALTNTISTDYYPDWSPDGTSLTYQSNRTGTLQIYRQRLDQDESTALQLTSGSIPKGAPSWSPDGSLIAYYTNVGQDEFLDLYVVPANGGQIQPLVTSANNEAVPSWSPNGQTVYFHQGNLGGTNIMSVDIATGDIRAITQRNDRNWVPVLRRSPDAVPIVPTQIPVEYQSPSVVAVAVCDTGLPSRLRLGERVRTLRDSDHILYSEPRIFSQRMTSVQPGLVMRIIEGPRCEAGLVWWRVQYGRIAGWLVETTGGEYVLESVENTVLSFLPPTDRIVPPNASRLLTGGIGLTNGAAMPDGDFQVEWYCNLQTYGVQNDDLNWQCTQNEQPIFLLDINDLDAICQATYFNPTAFAIQDGDGSIPAYRWRCYEYTENPFAK